MADARLVALLQECGADGLVSAEPGLVRMLTGHACDVGSGPSPFQLPALVVAPGEGPARLVCSQDEAPEGEAAHAYPGFTVGPLDPLSAAGDALEAALDSASLRGRPLLVDGASLPAGLASRLDGVTWAGTRLAALGAVKTPAEVEAVEAALRLCEAGQQAARTATREGADELELWAAVAAAVERAAAERTTMVADLVSGARTAEVGGPPGLRRLAGGDAVLCDLVPRRDGIWGDSCATWTVGDGDVPAGLASMHAAAAAALTAGLAALRPGALAGDVDATVREAMSDAGYEYPHHTGHGLGFHWHEEPRIVPGAQAVLQPGMVVALEPGAYRDGVGLRLEQVAVVTEGGCRVLSRHSLDLDAGAAPGGP
ncbi:MAG: M24 family metallopeptidase [Gaiellales bacterium]